MLTRIKLIRKLVDIARNHQVRLTGGIGISLQFLTEDTCLQLLPLLLSDTLNLFLSNGKNTTCTTSTIINMISVIGQLILDRHDSKVCQQANVVARRKMFTSFCHIVFLIEFTKQLLKDSSHRMVVKSRQAFHHNSISILIGCLFHHWIDRKVDVSVGELL